MTSKRRILGMVPTDALLLDAWQDENGAETHEIRVWETVRMPA